MKYLYENEEYLNDIRDGRIICEGIDIEAIKIWSDFWVKNSDFSAVLGGHDFTASYLKMNKII